MKAPRSPFVIHNQRWYLDPALPGARTATLLKRILKLLLERHPPEDILILRPMTSAEVCLLTRCFDDSEAEVFATVACTEEKRLGRSLKVRRQRPAL